MNRSLRSYAAVVWAVAGLVTCYFSTIWWDRARARADAPTLSGWGSLFIIGVIVLLIGMFLAWRLATNNHNAASVVTSAVCAVLLALGLAFVAPAIGWASSLRLSGLVLGVLAYLVVHFILARRPAA